MSRETKPEQDTADSREEFLTRWSRRKLEAGRGDQGTSASVIDSAENTVPEPGEADKVLTDADMPPIDLLDGDSDYSPFLSPGVSDDLRQQALRKLFTQPDFNITDGLNDYDEDYTHFAGLGNIITHEMKRMLQRELEADRCSDESAATQDEGEPGAAVRTTAETASTDAIAAEPVDTDQNENDTGNGEVHSG
ncbi:MAG: DUF3306 domain-containing protein [Gammaproteobacteria bacterium]